MKAWYVTVWVKVTPLYVKEKFASVTCTCILMIVTCVNV